MILPLAAALAGTLGYGTGSVLQAAAVRRTSGPAAIIQPLYVAGLGCDGAAWLLSLVALQHLPLFTVQALLAGSLAVTVLLARIFLKTRLRVRDGAAIAVAAVALAAVSAAAGAQRAGQPPAWFANGMLIGLFTVAVAIFGFYRSRKPIPLAALAGVAFSGAALGARGIQIGSVGDLVAMPMAWAIAGFGLAGVLAYSRALEHGLVGPVTAILWVIEVLLPGVLGVLVLGDVVRPGWGPIAAIAVAAAVGGCIVLGTGPGAPDLSSSVSGRDNEYRRRHPPGP